MQPIGAMLERTAGEYPDKVAIVFEDAALTYNELNAAVNRLANGLKNIGVKRGDRVMVQLTNGPEIIMAHYAIIRAGAIAVPLNVMYVAHEIRYIGNDTAAETVILDSSFLHLFDEVQSELCDLKHIVVTGESVPPSMFCLDDLISGSPVRQEPADVSLDDIVSIIYTSGTTGRPKGATQTHRSILSNVASLCEINRFDSEDKLLCALPLFNNFALNVVMMSTFFSGASMIVTDRFEAEKVMDHMTRHGATYFAGTPTMFVYLLQAYDKNRHDAGALRVVNSGGAHCPAALLKEVEETFEVIHMDGYGQTEGCGFTTINPL